MSNFVFYQRGAYNASIKTFNALTISITNQVLNKKCFIKILKYSYLINPSTYMKNILTCILGMRIQEVIIMSFMEFIVHLSIF